MQTKLRNLVAQVAKDELLPRFSNIDFEQKRDGSFLTEADLTVQARIAEELKQQWPHIEFLGEEMSEAEQQALFNSDEIFWCLDPIDGTSNFIAGLPYFSVSLALIENNKVKLGLVYDPVRDECFFAEAGKGAYLNEQAIQSKKPAINLKQSIGLIDFKRLPQELTMRLAEQPPYASQRSLGSVALDWCWLALGRCHVYLHGKQNIWDYAAGNMIFKEAGGLSSTLDGEEIFVNQLQPRSAVGAVSQDLFEQWTNWLEVKPK